MDNIKDDKYYLGKIIDDIYFIQEQTKEIKDAKEFDANELINSAVNFKFIQISENSKKLSVKCLESNKDIPWHKITGMRNKIVHNYDNVFIDIIFDTITNDLPVLIGQLKELFEKIS